MVKRAKVTAETYDEKKPSALDRLVGNTPESRGEPAPTPPSQASARTYKPTSIYLDDTQLDKLDELSLEYKKRRGKRINRNDIIRALVDRTDLDEIIRLIS